MILVDANILLYAENTDVPQHAKAVQWWDEQLSTQPAIRLPWPVLCAFIRISTNHRVFRSPLMIGQAADRVSSWLERPNVQTLETTPRHWTLFRQMLEGGQATGNLVSDAHLAALAIEHNCELFSSDADFARFPKLKWRNPLR